MHIPVLTKEILDYLKPMPGGKFIDCTLGEGGHTTAILKKIAPKGTILSIDLDARTVENFKIQSFKLKNKKNIILAHGNFSDLKKIVERKKFKKADGILIDLGWNIGQFENSGRGFSFQKDEPIDMRYDVESLNITARDIVNGYKEKDLADIFWKFGEERFSRKIAKAICKERKKKKIKTTFELVGIIQKSIPARFRNKKIHFATKTFQALRIETNRELENLEKALPQALDILKKEGRMVVVSFHSLEDRIVKNFFRQKKQEGRVKILTKKPVIASEKEIELNKRARSAKLRVIQKIKV